jgi:hypothetical protein
LAAIDEMLTLKHGVLAKVAERYKVPALVPHSTNPEDFDQRFGSPALVPPTGTSSSDFSLRVDRVRL